MKFKKTKPILSNEYHTHHILLCKADIIANHVQREQEIGGFTEGGEIPTYEIPKYVKPAKVELNAGLWNFIREFRV